MDVTKSFTIPKPIDQVWATITDLAQVVPFVPDATVVDGAGQKVTAQVKMRLGSMTMQYTGPAQIVEKNDASKHAVMTASAREKGGQGNADARVEVSLSGGGGGTNVNLKTSINVTGKAAQMGEGTIGPVTEALVAGFAANMAKM